MTARILDRKFPTDPTTLLPPVTPDNAPFWEALTKGRLVLQTCTSCGRARFPIAPVCPYCLGMGCNWQQASGRGRIHSWVRYQRSYLPEFEDLMPYVVISAALEEGVRMFGRLIDTREPPESGAPARLVVERWPGGRCVPAFELEDTEAR